MRTEEIIRNLNYTIKKHSNDRVGVGQTNITSMCKDILPKMEQLKSYEDAEEQGLLLRLPCKVGDTVWFIKTSNGKPELIETDIEKIGIKKNGMYIKLGCNAMYETSCNSIGKTVFLTIEEAEQKLAEMKGE